MDTKEVKTNIICNNIEDWSDIDWKQVNIVVVKLRRRIFDAKRAGKFRNLRSLQRLMLDSSANILYCIRKISYNPGSKTPGIDGETINGPSDRMRLYNDIFASGWNGFKPKPIRRIYIKEVNKLRPIGIPTIRDRVIQSMVCNALEPEWEAVFEKGSYGFRPKRNTNDAVSRLWLALNKPSSRKWVVDSDISKCFDSISHRYLLKMLEYFPASNLIKEMLEVGIIIRDVWLASEEEGTPQGSSLSPLLCNIALHGLESELGVIYLKNGYVNQKGRLIIRFADDLVILCHTKADALLALEQLNSSLSIRGLTTSELKTKIVHISEGFDFLGFNIKMCPKPYSSYNNSIIKLDEDYKINHKRVGIYASPSRKSVKKVKLKLKQVLMMTKGSTAERFVVNMNRIIMGYANAKLHWHSNKVFRELDHYLYKLGWRWAIRKHPKKGSKWIMNKYFIHLRLGFINSKWTFAADRRESVRALIPDNPFINENRNPSVPNQLYMLKFRWFPIKDYLVCKMDKLPDNRHDAKYYKELAYKRLRSKPFNIFRKTDKEIALSQYGICPICEGDLFDTNEELHLHHILPRNLGGKSTFANLVYLHIACHYKIHTDISYMEKYFEMLSTYKKNHPRINLRDEVID